MSTSVTAGTAPVSHVGRGILLMLLAVLFFTGMDATAKGLVREYPALQVIWARFLGQFLIVVLILRGRTFALARTRHPIQQIFRSLFQFGAIGFFFASLNHIGLAEATAIGDTSPLLITLGAALFLGEKLGPRRIAGVVAAMIGALIIIRPGFGMFTPWALLPFLSAVSYAGNALLTRVVGTRESVWTTMILGGAFGAILSSFTLPWLWTPIDLADLWLFALVGALGAAGQLCIIKAFSIAEASAIAPFSYVGIICATGWGILLYDEYPDLWTIVGALVIAGAGLYVWHRETKAARAAA
ncbi:DMT family transporter [Tabrizicola sp. J26]|uniref:DMT family transporter n=1 Tax=Alitabrizicola rongguiensis TaxID=2909234 RepID=UPI001F2560DB|nr:DMT family transporter [Tabrizicola rongguiensis]MCF1709654.1 DMT family transporter [Tabrizicola rongguiensis]